MITVALSDSLAEVLNTSRNWDEPQKVEAFKNSLESLMANGEIPDCDITLGLEDDRNNYGLVALAGDVSLFERGFRQTTVESFKLSTLYSIKEVRSKILKSLLSKEAVVPAGLERWLKFEPLVLGLDKELIHALPPGHYSGETLIVKKRMFARTPCYPIYLKDTKGWQSAFVDGLYVYKSPPDWQATFVSREEADRAEAEAEAEASASSISKAQKYVGWEIASISPGLITLVSPTGEEARLVSRHSVWNYGDSSEDWIQIDGISI